MADPWHRLHPARQVRLRHAPGGSSDPSPQSSSKSQYQLEIVKEKKKMLKTKKGRGGEVVGGEVVGGEVVCGEVVEVNRCERRLYAYLFGMQRPDVLHLNSMSGSQVWEIDEDLKKINTLNMFWHWIWKVTLCWSKKTPYLGLADAGSFVAVICNEKKLSIWLTYDSLINEKYEKEGKRRKKGSCSNSKSGDQNQGQRSWRSRQSINQSINRSFSNQSINRSINQSIEPTSDDVLIRRGVFCVFASSLTATIVVSIASPPVKREEEMG